MTEPATRADRASAERDARRPPEVFVLRDPATIRARCANVLAAACADGTVLIWHVFHNSGPALRVSNFGGPVVGVSFSPDGKGLATAEQSGRVRIWGDVAIPSHVGPPNELSAP